MHRAITRWVFAVALSGSSLVYLAACSSDEEAQAGALLDGSTADDDATARSETGTGDGAAGGVDAASAADACSAADAGVGAVCATTTDCPCGTVCGALRCVPSVACDEALLVWDGPVANADGTCVYTLSGFNVYWSLDAGPDAAGIDAGPFRADAGYDCVPGPLTACGDAGLKVPLPACTYRVKGLPNGTWVFTTTAYDDAGLESVPSTSASKTIACP